MRVRRLFLLFIFLSLLPWNGLAQLPNGGFESWVAIENFETPVFWETNQDTNFVRFEKDTFAIEGNYSLKVVPSASTAWHECMSMAWTNIKLPEPVGPQKTLTFYARTIPDTLNPVASVFLRITGDFFVDGAFHANFDWETFEPLEVFQKIELPISNPDVDSITLQIFGGALNGAADGCPNRSFSWIDGMHIEETTTGIENSLTRLGQEVQVYPNPSTGTLWIDQPDEHTISRFQIFSVDGKLLEQGRFNGLNIHLESELKGMFVLKLLPEDPQNAHAVIRRIVVE